MTQLETYISDNEARFLEDLKAWLRIPSISTEPAYTQEVYRAAEYAVHQLETIGFEQTQIIPTQGHPLVYGETLEARPRWSGEIRSLGRTSTILWHVLRHERT